jgi:hypothetical protein
MADDTEAYVAITRLQASYADVVTRRAWSELEPLFEPEARVHIAPAGRDPIDVIGSKALGEFIAAAVDRFEFFQFVPLNTVVELGADGTAIGRLYLLEVRQARETHEWSEAFGLYEDGYAQRDGQWRFAARNYRSLARRTGDEPASVFT